MLNGGDFSLGHSQGRVHDLSASAGTDTISINPSSDLAISLENGASETKAYGLYLTGANWNLFSGGNKYSFTVIDNGTAATWREFHAVYLDSATGTNKGSINVHGSGGNAYTKVYGVRTQGSTFTNDGTISVDSKSSARAVYADGGHFVNRGTLSATSASGVAYAVYATSNASVELGTGTVIENGKVFSNSVSTSLKVSSNSPGTLAFELGGAWSAITKTGSTTWELTSGTDVKAGSLTLSKGTLAMGSGAELEVSGTASVGGGSTLALTDGARLDASAVNLTSDSTLSMGSGTVLIVNGMMKVDGDSTLALSDGAQMTADNFQLVSGKSSVSSGATVDVSGTTTVKSGATLSLYEGSLLTTKNFTLNSGGTLFLSQGADASWLLKVTGATTLETGSSLVVSPTSEGTLNLIRIDDTSNYNGTMSVDSSNPNYTLSGIQIVDLFGPIGLATEATYAPSADQASQSLQNSMAASQSFASVATGRSLNLLSNVMSTPYVGAGTSGDSVFSQDEHGDYLMVASSGDLSGLLDPKTEESTWAVFAEPVVGTGHRGIVNGQGYDSRYAGLQFGADHFLNPDLLVGFTGGIGYVDIDFNGDDFYSKDTERQKLYIAGAYVGYKWNGFSFTDLLSNTYVTHHSRRHASSTDYAVGDYSSNILTNELIGAYTWEVDETWSVMPHLGYRISRLTRGAFEETDSANAIRYDDYQKIFHDVTAGARVTGHFTLGDYALAPYAGLGMTLALGDNDISVTQTLVGTKTSSRVTTGNDDTQFTFETGCTIGDGPFKVTLGYEGSRSDNEHNHSLSALFRWQY